MRSANSRIFEKCELAKLSVVVRTYARAEFSSRKIKKSHVVTSTMISPCAGDGSKHSYNEGVEGRPHPLLPDGADGDVEPERKRVKGGFVTRYVTAYIVSNNNNAAAVCLGLTACFERALYLQV